MCFPSRSIFALPISIRKSFDIASSLTGKAWPYISSFSRTTTAKGDVALGHEAGNDRAQLGAKLFLSLAAQKRFFAKTAGLNTLSRESSVFGKAFFSQSNKWTLEISIKRFESDSSTACVNTSALFADDDADITNATLPIKAVQIKTPVKRSSVANETHLG